MAQLLVCTHRSLQHTEHDDGVLRGGWKKWNF